MPPRSRSAGRIIPRRRRSIIPRRRARSDSDVTGLCHSNGDVAGGVGRRRAGGLGAAGGIAGVALGRGGVCS
jgi:hypothetical protein